MKRILIVAGFVLVLAGFAVGQSPQKQTGTAEDEAAIRMIVNHWQQAWEKFDASVLVDDYAEDADWLNAFGVRNKGREKILAFMTQVVKRPTVQGRTTIWGEPQVRFVRSDVAITTRDYQTKGHKTPDGVEMAERKTHCTWVLTKDNGKWRIASQMISDDNGAIR